MVGSGGVVVGTVVVAVGVGVILAALVFAWDQARRIRSLTTTTPAGAKLYVIDGPLFFASVANFKELFTPKDDPDEVIVDFANSRVVDHSALEAIDALAEQYR